MSDKSTLTDVTAFLARLEHGQHQFRADMMERMTRLEGRMDRLEAEQIRLREGLNDKLDDILDKLSANRADTDTVRGTCSSPRSRKNSGEAGHERSAR